RVAASPPPDRGGAVLELARRGPGRIRELVGVCAPNSGVVTNVGEPRMGFCPSREALAAAKGELVEGLAADGVAVLNADDPLAAGLGRRTRARVLSFGHSGGDVRAEEVRLLPQRGSTFRLRTPAGAAEVTLRVPGRHAVSNALDTE